MPDWQAGKTANQVQTADQLAWVAGTAYPKTY
jgi:hypothetical protein